MQREWTEIRAIEWKSNGERGISESFFVNNMKDFVEKCREWNGKRQVYAGYNPRPAVGATKDEQIRRITLLAFDIDSEHPKDEAATDAELVGAKEDLGKILKWLSDHNLPEPYVDFTGNGYRVALRCDVPVEEDTKDHLYGIFDAVKKDTGARIDNILNPSRIIKVPGTWSIKGASTPERPHRLAYVAQDGDASVIPGVGVVSVFIKNSAPRKSAKSQESSSGGSGLGGSDIVLGVLLAKDKKLNDLFLGLMTDKYGNDRSDAEMALAIKLFRAGLSEAQVRSAMAQSQIGKWNAEKDSYRDATIRNAHGKAEEYKSVEKAAQLSKAESVKDDKVLELYELASSKIVSLFRDQYKTVYAVIGRDTSHVGSFINDVRGVGVYKDTKDTILVSSQELEQEKKNILFTPGSNSQKDTNLVSLVSLGTDNNKNKMRFVCLDDDAFVVWLAGEYYDTCNKTASRDQIKNATLILKAKAKDAPLRWLYNRIAPDGTGGVWMDMGYDFGRAIHVTMDGWHVDENPPQIFYHYNHQMPLYTPVSGGSLDMMDEFLNLEDEDRILAKIAIISYLVPGVPHIGLNVIGPQGTGKSTSQLLIIKLLDPASTNILSLPSDEKELTQNLEHHSVCMFDNVGYLSRTQSDILCRAITGDAIEKRALYTNDESFIKQYMRTIGLNGISTVIEKSDLFSRMLTLNFLKIKDDARKTYAEMLEIMDRDGPLILGAILDILVRAIQFYPETQTKINVRMSDFARWGCAIAKAMGLEQSKFEAVYLGNLEGQDEIVVQSSLIAEKIIEYMDRTQSVRLEGSASELKELMEAFTNPPDSYGRPMGDLLSKMQGWAKTSTWFGRNLMEVAPSMESAGYFVKRTHGMTTRYIIERVVKKDVVDMVVNQGKDGEAVVASQPAKVEDPKPISIEDLLGTKQMTSAPIVTEQPEAPTVAGEIYRIMKEHGEAMFIEDVYRSLRDYTKDEIDRAVAMDARFAPYNGILFISEPATL
jgi:hypothetical protein